MCNNIYVYLDPTVSQNRSSQSQSQSQPQLIHNENVNPFTVSDAEFALLCDTGLSQKKTEIHG